MSQLSNASSLPMLTPQSLGRLGEGLVSGELQESEALFGDLGGSVGDPPECKHMEQP